ncbi:MAG: hypothetical protein GXX79_03795 [Actinomycetales bacterium]|nr:hypothetical protein [Actinomycetales bacterium]
MTPDSRHLSRATGVLVTVFAAILALGSLRPVGDPDLFWHLRTGEHLWTTWAFAGPEPWSRFSSEPWVLHEWLPELVFLGTYRVGGFAALAWLQAALAVALFLTLYGSCRRFVGPAPAGILAGVGWLGASAGLNLRPQAVTFVLLVVTTTTWLRTVEDRRARWWLVPLSFLWACSHGMWFTGPLVGYAVVLGLALDRRVTRAEGFRLLAVPALGTVAAALTPAGPRLLLAPFSVQAYTEYVSEWGAPRLTDPNVFATLFLALLVVVLWSRSTDRTSWTGIGLLVVAVGWSLLYARTVAVGACMLTPLLAHAAGRLLVPGLAAGNGTGTKGGSASLRQRMAIPAVSVLCLAVTAVAAPAVAARPAGVPDALDARLSALPPETVVLNAYQLGGWLHWRHRQLSPVIDGRTEVYSMSHVDAYMRARKALPGWEGTVGATTARVALLEEDLPLTAALERGLGWCRVAEDAGYLLLEAPGGPEGCTGLTR